MKSFISGLYTICSEGSSSSSGGYMRIQSAVSSRTLTETLQETGVYAKETHLVLRDIHHELDIRQVARKRESILDQFQEGNPC